MMHLYLAGLKNAGVYMIETIQVFTTVIEKHLFYRAQIKTRCVQGPTVSEPRLIGTGRPTATMPNGRQQLPAAAACKRITTPSPSPPPIPHPAPATSSMAAGGGGGGDIGADSERRLKKAMDKLYHFPKPKPSGPGGSKPSSSSAPAPRFCPTLSLASPVRLSLSI